jgi:hypothetical protein
MSNSIQDKEIKQYQELMVPPDKYSDGFGPKMIFAALFLGFMMVPGSIYLSLFMGSGLGPAAQWVTVILFAEVARRSMKDLRSQEVYLLYYMTGIALSGTLNGGFLSGLLWNQFLVQSQAATSMGVAQEIPWWIAPPPAEIAAAGRTFMTAAWLKPVLFIVGLLIIGRIDHFGLGYALYRLTAHVEKLPFPMAPVGALGITALAEGRDSKERWRWRCFSLGGVLGMAFGLIYVGLPAMSNAFLGHSIQIIPIPWLDFTSSVSRPDFMPAVPLNITFDAGVIILGMVLPFWAVIGGFIGLLITWVLNPILYHAGMLTTWQPDMTVVDTLYSNQIDFYLSFGIGLTFAIFFVGVRQVFKPIWQSLLGRSPSKVGQDGGRGGFLSQLKRNRERGDMSIVLSLLIYVFSTLTYIGVCVLIMPGDPVTGVGRFPWLFFLGFAFLYQPMIGYVNAKLEGMVGQNVSIPMVQQAAFILSGYRGAEIWFAPIPIGDHSSSVNSFRVMELTGTRLIGLVKVELIAVPVLLISSFLFCELIWRLAPIPSDAYPFTEQVWRLNALNFSLMVTSTMEGASPFMEALKFDIVGYGFFAGLFMFMFLSFLGLPTFLIYGAVRGLNQSTPGGLFLELIGAFVGRFYLQKKFGPQLYKKYVMVVFAGFSAGVGLIGMGTVALVLIANSATPTM